MSEERTFKRRRVAYSRPRGETPAFTKVGIDDAWRLFLAAKRGEGLRPRTIEDYSNTWRYFTTWLGEVGYNVEYVSDITGEMIREYIDYITNEAPRYKGHFNMSADSGKYGKGLATATINMRIRGLKVAFNYWLGESYIPITPMRTIKTQRDDEDAIEAFSDEQVDALLAACNQRTYVGFRDYVFQLLLLDTGMRMNEALSITPEVIDMKARVIQLEAKFNKNRRYRIIPISPETLKLLLELIDENRQHFGDGRRVFLSVYGEEVRDVQMNKRLKYYGDKTGVGKDIRSTAHTWRHTFAKNYILEGGDPYTLMRILGHSNIAMVRRYIQMTDVDVRTKHTIHSPINRIRKKLR